MSGDVAGRPDGKISMPLLDDVQGRRHDAHAARDLIREKLKKIHLRIRASPGGDRDEQASGFMCWVRSYYGRNAVGCPT